MAALSAGGLAPTTSPTFSPALKMMKVGMARTPTSWATSGTSSTSTLMKWADGYCSENLTSRQYTVYSVYGCGGTNLTRVGAMALQGPHQVAKASMITTSCSLRAAVNSALLYSCQYILNTPSSRLKTYFAMLWTPMIVAVDLKVLVKFVVEFLIG